jgi:hypothetical protein
MVKRKTLPLLQLSRNTVNSIEPLIQSRQIEP